MIYANFIEYTNNLVLIPKIDRRLSDVEVDQIISCQSSIRNYLINGETFDISIDLSGSSNGLCSAQGKFSL